VCDWVNSLTDLPARTGGLLSGFLKTDKWESTQANIPALLADHVAQHPALIGAAAALHDLQVQPAAIVVFTERC
jgi:hypothetical protein